MTTSAAGKQPPPLRDTRVANREEDAEAAVASPLTSLHRAEAARAVEKKAVVIDDLVPPSDTSCSPPSPSPSPPLPTQPAAVPPPSSAKASVTSDRPRLKVVIPPVPPFLHEVDKRNERERVRLVRLRGDKKATGAAQHRDRDDDSNFITPEKQQPLQKQTFKRKSRGGESDDTEQGLLFHESEYRMSQITPPPSERMLDHKNPPLPPRKMKRRRRIERPVNPITGRMTFSALPLPRLSLSSVTSSNSSGFSIPSPPMLDTPPGSPVRMSSVFRSLADEFAAVQDTPPLRTLRPPPRITRTARQCTPPISSRTRSAIQTPTTTMVLRSRQLNPSKS